jgi:amino acid transporter
VSDRPDLLALTAGAILAVFGVSGVLNTTGLVAHPGWIPPTLAVAVLAAAATARSLHRLIRPAHPSTGAEHSSSTADD